MKRSIKFFTYKGLTIKIHWTFLFVLLWLIIVNSYNKLTFDNFIWSLIFVVLVLVSIIIHELAHYAAGKYFNITFSEINLLPTGGVAIYQKFPENLKEEMLISFAGPLANLAIAGILLPFVQTYEAIWDIKNPFYLIQQSNYIYILHLVNLGLFLVNLVPAVPLCGGRILRAILGLRMNYFKAIGIVTVVSKIIAILLLLAGIFYLKILLIILSLLIFSAIQAEEYIQHMRSLMKGVRFGEVVVNDYQSLLAYSTVKEVMGGLMNNHTINFLVMENGLPVGTVQRMQIIKEAAEKHFSLKVKELMKKKLICFNAMDDVSVGFKTLFDFPYRTYAVIEAGYFKGVVSMMCILEYLMLHQVGQKEQDSLRSLISKV